MQALQTRSRAISRRFVQLAAGAALIGTTGLIVPGIGDPAPVAARDHQQTASMSAQHAAVPTAVHDYRAITKAGHRYYLYLADGVDLGAGDYRYVLQDELSPSWDFSHHRYHESATELEPGDDGNPENHRIGQRAG